MGPLTSQIRPRVHLPWNDAAVVAVAESPSARSYSADEPPLPSSELATPPELRAHPDPCHPGGGDLAATGVAAGEAVGDVKAEDAEAAWDVGAGDAEQQPPRPLFRSAQHRSLHPFSRLFSLCRPMVVKDWIGLSFGVT